MRNLAKVVSRSSYNVKSSTIRNLANCGLRQFSTEEMALERTRTRKKKSYVDERTSLAMEAIKNHYKSKGPSRERYFRVLNKEVAEKFVDLIMSHPAIKPLYVAEISPAFGLLTRGLLDAGVPEINLFESMEHFHPDLTSIGEEYLGRVDLKKVPFDDVCHVGFRDSLCATDKLGELVNNVDERSWEDEPTFHVIGAVPDNVFITRILSMVIYRHTLAKYGRMVLHLAIPENVWAPLSSGNENYRYYTSRSILFQALFSYQLLGTLPRTAFCPKFTKKPKRTVRWTIIPKYDINKMCVVRIEAKCDLYNKYGLTEKDIVPLCHFVKHHYRRRTSRIIPEMEKWVPGCGRELIGAGYDVLTQFGELLPEEIVKLFLLFKSWPGYRKSSFISMLDRFPKKIDEETVFGTTTDKIDEMFKVSRDAFNAQAQLQSSLRRGKST